VAPWDLNEHVPTEPARVHALQTSEQPLEQQMPSAQEPLRHSVFSEHGCPFPRLQRPIPSHWVTQVPAGTASGVPFGMFEQVPAAWSDILHDWHTPQKVAPQQTPSTQWPLKHWLDPLQAWPSGFFGTQVVTLQYVSELHWHAR
jgi:hypothetical protein